LAVSTRQKAAPGANGIRSASIGTVVVLVELDVVLDVDVELVVLEVDVDVDVDDDEEDVLVDDEVDELVVVVLGGVGGIVDVLVGGGALVCVMAKLLYVHGSGEHVGPVTVPAANPRACPSEPVKDRSVVHPPTIAVSEPVNCPLTAGVNTPTNWPLIPPVICLLLETHDPLTP